MKTDGEDLIPVTIDLNQKELTESFLAMFGETVKIILRRMFGPEGLFPKGTVKGTPTQIKNFEGALGANRNYIQSYIDNGLNSPRTYKSKYQLQSAVERFERQTGIKWPFK